uniref:Ig-like domain-containing protein n=1 Tax=Lates calcarifer TaxID=8187 RepID=A0A4W6DCM8_LATCA
MWFSIVVALPDAFPTLCLFMFCKVNRAEFTVNSQPQVIGSSQPIIAAPGYDVILPCHLEPAIDVQGFTVEWSKPDLKPDPSDRLSRVEYVHLYRDRREVPDMKIPSYIRRTALFTDDMKHGNISLKIMNVTSEDEGRYKCFIPKLRSPVKFSIVRLVVDPAVPDASAAPLSISVLVCHVVVGIPYLMTTILLVFICRDKRRGENQSSCMRHKPRRNHGDGLNNKTTHSS